MDMKIAERLEELVHKISYNGYRASIPEEWLTELNDLTGNNWPEEGYKEFCVEYECRSTLEETVYALLHDGEYPENRTKDLYFWQAKRELELSDEQIMFKLRKLRKEVIENLNDDFEDLPVKEFYEWLCSQFPEWKVKEEVGVDRIHTGSFKVDFMCDDIEYARYKYVLFEACRNKTINLDCCNLYDEELQAIRKFAEEHQMYVFEW